MVKLLLVEPTIDINAADIDGATPLWWATRGHHDHVAARLLAEPNLDVNAVGQFQASIPDRSTSLHHAVQGQRLPILRLLLTERRLDPNITDRLRRTPLGWAASQGNSEVVELLLAGQISR